MHDPYEDRWGEFGFDVETMTKLGFAGAFPPGYLDADPSLGATTSIPRLAVLVAWGLLGLVLSLRFFRWTPRR